MFFLQETHTTPSVVPTWEKEWGSRIFFSHCLLHKCGVAILTPQNLDFKVTDTFTDEEGRFLKLTINHEILHLSI